MLGNLSNRLGEGPNIVTEYGKFMERQQAEQVLETERRRINASMQNQVYGAGLGAQTGSTQQAYNQAMQQKVMNQALKPLPRFGPNKSEAYLIPLSQAVTMWQVKFGDKWFDGYQTRPEEGKDFYADVFARIKEQYLFENVDGWYRLKENVENLLANH